MRYKLLMKGDFFGCSSAGFSAGLIRAGSVTAAPLAN